MEFIGEWAGGGGGPKLSRDPGEKNAKTLFCSSIYKDCALPSFLTCQLEIVELFFLKSARKCGPNLLYL